MRRRAFVAGMAAVMAAPRSAPVRAQTPTRIGVLYPGVDNDIFRGNFDGFRTSLAGRGYTEGRNVLFELRFGEGRELRPIATKLTEVSPDLVLAVRPLGGRCRTRSDHLDSRRGPRSGE